MKKIIIGNLKSYLNTQQIDNLLGSIKPCENLILAPSSIFLSWIREKYPDFTLASQDVSSLTDEYGAYTGEVTAKMLKGLGISYSIIGHSERRTANLDNPKTISAKIRFCLDNYITPIICIGESKEERESGDYLKIIENQLKETELSSNGNIVIAYEPLWSIGTGLIPSLLEIEEVLSLLRKYTKSLDNKTFLVYGGSVNVENVDELISIREIDGLLIGKASTDSEKLSTILGSVNLR